MGTQIRINPDDIEKLKQIIEMTQMRKPALALGYMINSLYVALRLSKPGEPITILVGDQKVVLPIIRTQ